MQSASVEKKPKSKCNTVKTARPAHRPTAYKPEFARIAFRHALLGATDKEIAEILEVDVSTVNRWKLVHPAFCESLKKGKKEADAHVAKCLYGRATGYDHPDTHISNFQGVITVTPVTKHHPPDVTAQIFWLKNRQPDRFRDKPEVSVTLNNEVTVDTGKQAEELTVPQLRARLADLRSRETNGVPA